MQELKDAKVGERFVTMPSWKGNAVVCEEGFVTNRAMVKDNAIIKSYALIFDDAKIFENAVNEA